MKKYFVLYLVYNLINSSLGLMSFAFAESKPKIVCTTGMIADVVRQLVDDQAEVVQLIASGVDPHLYKPTRSDIFKLKTANVVFYNGLYLEGKLEESIKRVSGFGVKVYPLGELIDRGKLISSVNFSSSYDPHIWMDPLLWLDVAIKIKEKLVLNYPGRFTKIDESLSNLKERILDLDKESRKMFLEIDKDSRVLITAHDAFSYFGKSYDFQVRGIQGISTDSQAGVRDIEELVELIVKRKVKAVFVESTVSEKNINALVEGVKARGFSLKIGGSLFSDAMGPNGTQEGTYIGMIKHNFETIFSGLK